MLPEDLLVTFLISRFLCLTKTVEDAKVAILCIKNFLCDDLLALAVKATPLRVANHHMIHRIVLDVISCDLACIGTFAIGTAVLRADHDARLHDGLHQRQMQEAR